MIVLGESQRKLLKGYLHGSAVSFPMADDERLWHKNGWKINNHHCNKTFNIKVFYNSNDLIRNRGKSRFVSSVLKFVGEHFKSETHSALCNFFIEIYAFKFTEFNCSDEHRFEKGKYQYFFHCEFGLISF